MTNYINELIQETIGSKDDYSILAKAIYNYISNNSEDKYKFIVDAMQMLILQHTDKFLMYQTCEDMYFAIKGFESIYK
jgi:hypothetical protein